MSNEKPNTEQVAGNAADIILALIDVIGYLSRVICAVS